MIRNNVFIICLLFLFICCQNKKNNRVQVARVSDSYLYLDQIPPTPISIDSLIFTQNFINSWATKKLLIDKAEFNFNNYPIYIDSLVNVYKESLLIHYYKEAVVQSYLDTIISDSLIIDYYNNHVDDFKLHEAIVKLNYIKVRHVAPNIDFLTKNYSSTDPKILLELEEYCLQFAERFFLGDVDWISWPSFSKQLPLEGGGLFGDVKKILKQKSTLELADSVYRYFIFIQDFKLKGTSSPLEYVSSLINKILINKRKKELIKNIEYTLLEEAILNNNFEIYE